MIIRATKKVLTANKTTPTVVDENQINNLNEWYVTLISSTFPGKILTAYIHNSSFLTVITEGKSIKQNHKKFTQRLNALLERSSFPPALISEFNKMSLQIDAITTTNNRSTLGRINQLVDHLKWRFRDYETYQDIDFVVEENILLEFLYGYKNRFITPVTWWNNYILGNDPFDEFDKKNATIKASVLNSDGLTQQEEWHMENQMLKIDLEQRFGKPIELNTHEDVPKIPLFIENEFLKHMSNFENQFKDAKETSIHELIGHPKFKHANELKDTKLKVEIFRILRMLSKHNIEVDFLANYPEEIIYTFLTTELMEKSVPDVTIPGFSTHFIYEEFHPNHPFLIEGAVNWLTGLIYNPELNDSVKSLHLPEDFIVLNNQKIKLSEFKKTIKTFQITNSNFDVLGVNLTEVKIDDTIETAVATGFIELKNEIKGKRRIKKPIIANFSNTDEWWVLREVTFEDLN